MPATITAPPAAVGPQQPAVSAWVGATRLVFAKAIQYEDVHNDYGSWSFTITNGDDTAAERAALAYFTEVSFFELDETDPAFVGIVEDIRSITVDVGEEVGEVTQYSGRGILAELDRALVYGPQPIEEWTGPYLAGLSIAAEPYPEVRYHNYAGPSLDRSDMTDAVEIVTAGQDPAQFPPGGYAGAPVPWPYYQSYWIAPRAISGGAHPPGDWYAFGNVPTAGAFSYDMVVAVGVADEAWVWWDGCLVAHLESKDALKPHLVNIKAHDATHKVVVRIRHGGNNASGDITGLNLCVFPRYADGGGWLEDPLTYTTDAWQVYDYPSAPPGYSVDQVVAEYIAEPQARPGVALLGWTTDWVEGEDSGGEPMGVVTEVDTPVGNKVGDGIKGLTENYIEFGVDYANPRALKIWHIPGVDLPGGGTATGGGNVTDVVLERHVNLWELTHHDTPPEATALLAKWSAGWQEISGPVDEDFVRYEGFLDLSDSTDGLQMFYDAVQQLLVLEVPSQSIENLRHKLTADTQYRVRDYVTAPDVDGDPQTWRVVKRAVTTDDDGNGIVTTSLGVPRDTAEARNDRWRRKALGTLDGRSENASPSRMVVLGSEMLSPVRLRFSTGGSGVTIVGDRGSPERPDETLLVLALELEADVAGTSGGTQIQAEKNAVTLGDGTIASSGNYDKVNLGRVLLTPLDQANIETLAAGGHQGVSATLICMAATR